MDGNATQLPTAKSGSGTQGTWHLPLLLYPTGLSPSAVPHSSGLRVAREGRTQALQLHIPLDLSPKGSVCPLPVSVALTPGIPFWFLFLGVLRCFTSPRSHSGLIPEYRSRGRIPIREPRDQWLHAPTPGLSQLGTPFVGASSRAIHQQGYCSQPSYLLAYGSLIYLVSSVQLFTL